MNNAYDPYTGRRVLVTGASGFIGRHLVAALQARRARLRILVRENSQTPVAWDGVRICHGDLEDTASLAGACQGMDVVFHAAGFAHAWTGPAQQSAERHWRVNAKGTRALVETAGAAGVTRFVFLSSVKAMGEGGERCIDESWPLPPQTPYGKAKRAAEAWVLEAAQRYNMQAVNLRLAMVYGPSGRGNLERMARAIHRGWFPPLPEVGNRRCLVYVDDVVQAVLCSASHPQAKGTYIVTDGHSYSSREIYDLIRHTLGKSPTQIAVPVRVLCTLAGIGDWLGRMRGQSIGFDSETLDKLLGWACYRSDRIQQELGYRPHWTLAEALPKTLQELAITGKVPE